MIIIVAIAVVAFFIIISQLPGFKQMDSEIEYGNLQVMASSNNWKIKHNKFIHLIKNKDKKNIYLPSSRFKDKVYIHGKSYQLITHQHQNLIKSKKLKQLNKHDDVFMLKRNHQTYVLFTSGKVSNQKMNIK